jgi:molybdate transport system substrate-binding protein
MMIRAFIISLILLFSLSAHAELARIAVATNFKAAAEAIFTAYQDSNADEIQRSYGATGKLASQILHGAQYDVFLSADDISNPKLEPFIIATTRQSYAYGKLALWSANSSAPASLDEFSKTSISCLAMANPKLAPYGKAAQEAVDALKAKGLSITTQVTGQSVAHAFQFVASSSCEWGLVAQAQLIAINKQNEGLLVPTTYYSAIKQNAVLLKHGEHNSTAQAFLKFLKSKPAQDIILEFGYDLP